MVIGDISSKINQRIFGMIGKMYENLLQTKILSIHSFSDELNDSTECNTDEHMESVEFDTTSVRYCGTVK